VPHLGSIRQLTEGRHLYEEMHFVHCGSLLECLAQAQATDLVHALFAMLRPGGTLLVTNLLDDFPEAGYIEAYMDWRIAYRTREALEATCARLPRDAVASMAFRQNAAATLGAMVVRRR
jgi:extracellular factor (EF) 3-hydroxypalmitic acid methyl ester biosynthesis protein